MRAFSLPFKIFEGVDRAMGLEKGARFKPPAPSSQLDTFEARVAKSSEGFGTLLACSAPVPYENSQSQLM